MNESELPNDFADLEGQLRNRWQLVPRGGFRQKVLGAMALARDRDKAPENNGLWRFAAAMAAAVLLGINLSMSVAADTDWRLGECLDSSEIEAQAAQIRQLLPEIPEREAYRQALLLWASSRVVPTAEFRVVPNQALLSSDSEFWKGNESWPTR
jgi:hypothetical protein